MFKANNIMSYTLPPGLPTHRPTKQSYEVSRNNSRPSKSKMVSCKKIDSTKKKYKDKEKKLKQLEAEVCAHEAELKELN